MAKSMRYSLPATLILGAWCAVAAMPASAQIYKWIDAQGQVNYGDKPPLPKARELDGSTVTLSVYPAPRFPLRAAEVDSDVATLGRKIDSLQRQLDQERQARRDSTEAATRYDPCLSAPGPGCGYEGGYAPSPIVIRPTQGMRQPPGARRGAKIFPVGKI